MLSSEVTVASSAKHAIVDRPNASTRGYAEVGLPEPLKAVEGGDK